MEREIKFRGLRIDGKGWIYGSLLLPTTDNLATRIIAWNGTRFEVDPKSVSQYTGLKDKNGVDIYEGDIVKHPLAEEPEEKGFIVKWKDASFVFVNANYPDDEDYNMTNLDYLIQIDVICNIYQSI